MWFKNLQIYRLPAGWPMAAGQLETQLSRYPFQPCGSMEMQSRGWLAPRGDERLVYELGRQWLLALGLEHKLLPAAVVNQEAQARAAEIEARDGYKPGRKQLREIRERVAEELLPRAFSRRRAVWVWIDPVNGWLCVDAANAARAEEALELLNKSLDDLPLTRLHTRHSPVQAMADWLAGGEAPAGFTIDRDCELKALTDEKAAVRYVRHALDGDEIRAHLQAGKQPTRLALTWNDRISFVLTEKLEVKRLAFLDLLREEAEQQADDAEEIFAVGFALMTGELARMLADLVAALGGEEADG